MTLKFERWTKFRNEEIERPQPVIYPIINRGSLGMVHGPRGIGKSLFAQQLAYCVAAGNQFLNWSVPEAASVVYADGEMTDWERQRRFKRIEGPDLNPEAGRRLCIITRDFTVGAAVDLETREGQELFERLLPDDAALIVIDNLSAWCRSGRENAESWRGIQEWLMGLRARGKAVLLIHHTNKRGGQRGTSMREDALDYVISLRQSANQDARSAGFDVRFEKLRHIAASKVPPIHVEHRKLKNKPLKWVVTDLQASGKSERILELKKTGLTNGAIAKRLGIHRSNVGRHLKQLER